MAGLNDNGHDAQLAGLVAVAVYASLHTADPGTTGTNEVTGGSPAYARKVITWGTPATSSIAMAATFPVFNVPAATTIAYLGYWSLATGGTFYGSRVAVQPGDLRRPGHVLRDLWYRERVGMILLAAADTLAGVADAASKVTVSIFGMTLTGSTEAYSTLYQGQLSNSAATIYTSTGVTTFIRSITVVNPDTASHTFQFFRAGTAAANAITPTFTLGCWDDGRLRGCAGLAVLHRRTAPSSRTPTFQPAVLDTWGTSGTRRRHARPQLPDRDEHDAAHDRPGLHAVDLDAGRADLHEHPDLVRHHRRERPDALQRRAVRLGGQHARHRHRHDEHGVGRQHADDVHDADALRDPDDRPVLRRARVRGEHDRPDDQGQHGPHRRRDPARHASAVRRLHHRLRLGQHAEHARACRPPRCSTSMYAEVH